MSPNKGKKKTARRKRGSVDCKTVLMDAVVHLTAVNGIENLSTRIIADTAPGICGDVYIYNIFGNKENLLLETFCGRTRNTRRYLRKARPCCGKPE